MPTASEAALIEAADELADAVSVLLDDDELEQAVGIAAPRLLLALERWEAVSGRVDPRL